MINSNSNEIVLQMKNETQMKSSQPLKSWSTFTYVTYFI